MWLLLPCHSIRFVKNKFNCYVSRTTISCIRNTHGSPHWWTPFETQIDHRLTVEWRAVLEKKPASGFAILRMCFRVFETYIECARCSPRAKRMTRVWVCARARLSIQTTTHETAAFIWTLTELNEQIVWKYQSSRTWRKINNVRNAQFDMKCGSAIATVQRGRHQRQRWQRQCIRDLHHFFHLQIGSLSVQFRADKPAGAHCAGIFVGKICIGAHGLCDRSVPFCILLQCCHPTHSFLRSLPLSYNEFIHTRRQRIVLLLRTGYRSPAKLFVNACVSNDVHNMPNMSAHCEEWSAQTFHKYFTVSTVGAFIILFKWSVFVGGRDRDEMTEKFEYALPRGDRTRRDIQW